MTRSLNKEHAPIGGEGDFCHEAAKLTFGENSNVLTEGRNVNVQGISGTGSLRISAELITLETRPMYLSKPNRTSIFNPHLI